MADPDRGFWVVWTGQRHSRWVILGRHFVAGRWQEEIRLSPLDNQACFHAAAAGDGTSLHVAWERLAAPGPEIWVASFRSGRWDGARRVASGSEPSVAVDREGQAWMAWHVARDGRYVVATAHTDRSTWSSPEVIASGIAHYRRASIAASPDGDVWVACEGFVPTADDRERDYRLDDMCYLLSLHACTFRCRAAGWEPAPPDPSKRHAYLPRVLSDAAGVWLVYYRRQDEKFRTLATAFDHGQWAGEFDCSTLVGYGRKTPPAALITGGSLLVAVQTDDRARVDNPTWTIPDAPSRISLVAVDALDRREVVDANAAGTHAPLFVNPDHARGPQETTGVGAETLTLYFGDLHKHSEISRCGRLDGHIEETYAYARDIRQLDFMQSADHAEHQNEHDWHQTRRYASLFNGDGSFVAFSGYEWTSEFQRGDNLREGHYNPTFLTDADHLPCLSASLPGSNTPGMLWQRLRDSQQAGEGVLLIAHHPGRLGAPLDWHDFNPIASPLIEVAQARGSFEHYLCPDAERRYNDTARVRGHMIQDGLARGCHFGFVGASDHAGQPLTGVWAPSLVRRAIFDALRRGRCYATNGPKIVLDVRVDGRFMGEAFDSVPHYHTIAVRASGRAIDRVDIWKDGRILHTERGGGCDAMAFEVRDTTEPDRQESYYYARVIQQHMGIAWSSPTWVRHVDVEPQVCFYVDDKELDVVEPRAVVTLPMVLRNERPVPVEPVLAIRPPEGWESSWRSRALTVRPGSWAEASVELTAPAGGHDDVRAAELVMEDGARCSTARVRFRVGPRPAASHS